MTRLVKRDIPQKEDFSVVRAVVTEVATGATEAEAIARATTIELRHVDYALQAARVLGWVERTRGAMRVTESGRALCATRPGSRDERRHLRRAVEATAVVRQLVPYLLASKRPARGDIELALIEGAGLAPSTAGRRAQTLLAWRRQLVDEPDADGDGTEATLGLQLPLFAGIQPGPPRRRR